MTKEEKSKRRKELRYEHKKSELFKECTDRFVAELEKHGYHIEDIHRSSGYFIFEFGGNSVNTFWLKEVPGWRFGLWWTLNQDIKPNRATAEFFTQFEKDVDKFKPTRSTFIKTKNVYLDKSGWKILNKSDLVYSPFEDFYDWEVEPILKFIKEHPYRAWARSSSSDGDMYKAPWSGFKCWRKYHEHMRYMKREKKFQNWADKKLVDWFGKNVMKFYKDWGVYEHHNCSPKFEFYVPLSENRNIFRKRGLYSAFLDDEDLENFKKEDLADDVRKFVEESPKLEKEFEKLKEKLMKLSDRKNVYYYPEVGDTVLVLNKKGYEDFKNNKVGI